MNKELFIEELSNSIVTLYKVNKETTNKAIELFNIESEISKISGNIDCDCIEKLAESIWFNYNRKINENKKLEESQWYLEPDINNLILKDKNEQYNNFLMKRAELFLDYKKQWYRDYIKTIIIKDKIYIHFVDRGFNVNAYYELFLNEFLTYDDYAGIYYKWYNWYEYEELINGRN